MSQMKDLLFAIVSWLLGKLTHPISIILLILQEKKLEDDSFPVDVPAVPSECRLDAVSDSHAIPVPELHLLISARDLPRLPAGHY